MIYPKYITSDSILRYVRAMQNTIGSNVETLYHVLDNQAEALEFIIRDNSPVVGIPLSKLNLKNNLLVCCLTREGTVRIPRGQDSIQIGDNVIIVTTHKDFAISAIFWHKKGCIQMNFRIIAYIVGWVCNFQAMFMVLPCITALIYQEHEFFAFLISMIVCLIVGLPLTIRKPKNKVFYTKDGCVAVALSWFALCISGAVPFVLSGAIPHPIDAFFETVSGFTTTGIQYPDRCGSSPSLYSDMEKFHTLDRWHGGSCILALTATTCRRVSYESDESRKPWSFRQQTGSKSSADRQNSLHDLYWNDTVPDYSSSDWQNSSVRYPVYFFWYSRYWWIWYRQ